MTRAFLVKLLIAESVLLVLVGWAGTYFARDEFLLATERTADQEIRSAAAPAAADDDGVPTVRLSAAAQRNVGIEVAMPQAAVIGGDTEMQASVLDIQPLTELRGRLQAARHEAVAAHAVAAASALELKRVQGLYEDDRNASQRALESAAAQAAADAARENATAAGLESLRAGARASWGPKVAAWLDSADGAALRGLTSGREVLLRVSVPADELQRAGATLQVRVPGVDAARPARVVGPAPLADVGGVGRGVVARTTGDGLAPGMRLVAHRADAAPQAGVLVPAAAVVWHVGQPWVYVRESSVAAPPGGPAAARDGSAAVDDDQPAAPPASAAGPAPAAAASAAAAGPASFQRRAVPHARRQGPQWFLPGFEEDDPVVVQGAQVLLSEELKFQIRNENDD